jgi:hypothetical protein
MDGEIGSVTGMGMGLGSAPSGEVSVSLRSGWLKHLRVVLGSAGGAALVLGILELLQHEPNQGFGLLAAWGPWPVIALFALALLGRFMSRMNDTIQTTFGAVVTSVQQQAAASGKTAEALSRLADQGGRQSEEVRRLAIYAGRELGGISERFDAQDKVLGELGASLRGLHRRLDEGRSKPETEQR